MKNRILLIGNGPLPAPGQSHAHNAAVIRTTFFRKALIDDGHDVRCALIDASGKTQSTSLPHEVPSEILFSKDDPRLLAKLTQLIHRFQPAAIVAVNTHPSFVAASLKTEVPLWCDLNGWVMAEAQSQAKVLESNALLPHLYKMEKTVVQRADRISAVSTPQKHATIGELSFAGRLNTQTASEALVHVIPNYFEPLKATPPREDHKTFNILFCGGYNTWVDAETLFKGLEYAMDHDASIHYLSTGGAIEGLDNQTFNRFKSMCSSSKHVDRFNFLGWVPSEEIPKLYAKSDVGVNVDLPNYESEFGARNRINEMIVRGLPVVSSLNSEITRELHAVGAILTFPPCDFIAFGEALLKLKHHSDLRHELAKKAKSFAEEHYDYRKTTAVLRAWCANPVRSGDAHVKVNLSSYNPLATALFSLKNVGFKKTAARVWKRARKIIGR